MSHVYENWVVPLRVKLGLVGPGFGLYNASGVPVVAGGTGAPIMRVVPMFLVGPAELMGSTLFAAMKASSAACTVLYSELQAWTDELVVKPTRLSVTIPASTPRIVTTTRSSIRVNPRCPFLPRRFSLSHRLKPCLCISSPSSYGRASTTGRQAFLRS